jgi:hypothetical protein
LDIKVLKSPTINQMKIISMSVPLLFLTSQVSGQTINRDDDSTLAGWSGADEYGMKPYVLVILKTGINVT